MNTSFGDLKKKKCKGSECTGSVSIIVAGTQDTHVSNNGGDDEFRLMHHFIRDFIEAQED